MRYCKFIAGLLFLAHLLSPASAQATNIKPPQRASQDVAGFLPGGIIDNAYWGIAPDDSNSAKKNVAGLNRALEQASNNGISSVKLSQDTYYVDGQHTRIYSVSDQSISIPSGIHLDLDGSTLIQIPNSMQGYAIFTIVGVKDVCLFNGILVGDRKEHIYSGNSTHEYGFGVDIRGSANISLSDLEIYDMTGDSILIGGKDTYLAKGGTISENITVTNCCLHDNRRQGLSIMGGQNITIKKCSIYNIGIENGTNPSCGIDLENELDWPVEYVRITQNKFANNGKAAIMVHRGSSNTLIDDNDIIGYIALVDGKYTSIKGNRISNGGIFSVDTPNPVYSVIEDNTLNESDIQIIKNYATIVRHNTITEGMLKFNYACGAVYDNIVSNNDEKAFAIQVYADKQVNHTFFVYLNGNSATGKYTDNAEFISKYTGLKIITDRLVLNEYANSFGTEPIPLGTDMVDVAAPSWLLIIMIASLMTVIILLFARKKRLRRIRYQDHD